MGGGIGKGTQLPRCYSATRVGGHFTTLILNRIPLIFLLSFG